MDRLLRSSLSLVRPSLPSQFKKTTLTPPSGNVGLSLGYPEGLTSLSGVFTTFSKLVICAMMIRGRHRGLPYALDRAIMLPEETLVQDDSEATESRE